MEKLGELENTLGREGRVTAENFDEVLHSIPTDISLRVEGKEYDPTYYEGKGGVYSNIEILNALLDGHITIYPFVPENLNGASYNVTLGNYFYAMDKERMPFFEFLSEADINRYFKGPIEAEANLSWVTRKRAMPFRNIPDDHPVIVIDAMERLLAHTHEFIGIKPPGTSVLHARSTMGRNGITVCKDAGWGDPGYEGRWTSEMENTNKEHVPLPVGFPFAQMTFVYTPEVAGSYNQQGSYYRDKSLSEAIRNWRAEMMLPKPRPDQVKAPIPIEANQEVDLRTPEQKVKDITPRVTES